MVGGRAGQRDRPVPDFAVGVPGPDLDVESDAVGKIGQLVGKRPVAALPDLLEKGPGGCLAFVGVAANGSAGRKRLFPRCRYRTARFQPTVRLLVVGAIDSIVGCPGMLCAANGAPPAARPITINATSSARALNAIRLPFASSGWRSRSPPDRPARWPVPVKGVRGRW